MIAEKKIAELGIVLPAGSKPAAKYVPAVRTGNLIFVSGQIPTADGKLAYTGKAGGALTLEDAQAAARLCMINGLAALKAELGDLDRVRQIAADTEVAVGHIYRQGLRRRNHLLEAVDIDVIVSDTLHLRKLDNLLLLTHVVDIDKLGVDLGISRHK